MDKIFSRIRKSFIYFPLPLILASCSSSDMRAKDPSFLERVVNKMKENAPPSIDSYFSFYEREVRKTTSREFQRTSNIPIIVSNRDLYREYESPFAIRDDLTIRESLRLPLKICEKSFKEAGEEVFDEYLEGLEVSAAKKSSEDSKYENIDFSFRPGYSRDLTLKGVMYIKDLKFFQHSIGGQLKTQLGTEGGGLWYERNIGGGFYFCSEYFNKRNLVDFFNRQTREPKEGVQVGFRRPMIEKEGISDIYIFLGHGNSKYHGYKDEGSLWIFLGYSRIFK
jgi:hypothetical protein